MKYYLNPYLPIIAKDDRIRFPLEIGSEGDVLIDDCNRASFDQLLSFSGVEEESLTKVWGRERIDSWKQSGVLLPFEADRQGRNSRTDSYYFLKKLGSSKQLLRTKTVLILGCGGVGSHVAWNLAALGVGQLYLLDCDNVELSNLNRQLLYDTDDIGREKVQVLSEKLFKINPDIRIVPLSVCVDSETKLEKIVLNIHPDCIVKSLDYPMYVSNWVDSVCERTSTKYISCIMNGTQQLIGPTYAGPGSARFGDFFSFYPDVKKVSGLGPSISFELAHMGAAASEEAFKLLTGTGELMYQNRIEMRENITNECTVMTAPGFSTRRTNVAANSLGGICCLLALFWIARLFSLNNPLIYGILAILYALIVPLFISGTQQEAMEHCSIFLICGTCLNLLLIVTVLRPLLQTGSQVTGLISIGFTILSLQLLLCVALERVFFRLKENCTAQYYKYKRK